MGALWALFFVVQVPSEVPESVKVDDSYSFERAFLHPLVRRSGTHDDVLFRGLHLGPCDLNLSHTLVCLQRGHRKGSKRVGKAFREGEGPELPPLRED